jgi:hypothetical protein
MVNSLVLQQINTNAGNARDDHAMTLIYGYFVTVERDPNGLRK